MVSSKCVLLLSIVWCVGTLGQFFQDEVFVDVEDYAEQCDTVAKENEIFLVHFRGFLPDGTEFFSRYVYLIYIDLKFIMQYQILE